MSECQCDTASCHCLERFEAENARLQDEYALSAAVFNPKDAALVAQYMRTLAKDRDDYKALAERRGEAVFPGGCKHGLDKERHSFSWGEGPRNIWNPVQPKCTECGQTIGELFRAALVTMPEEALKREKG